MDILQKIVDVGFPFLVGGAIGYYFNFIGGFSKEYFAKRERKLKHKLNVAQHVLQICNEASTGNFRKLPRDMEHINSVMTNLDRIDKKMGVLMNEMVASWNTFARERSVEGKSGDDVRFLKEQLDRAEKNRKILIEWANKVRY